MAAWCFQFITPRSKSSCRPGALSATTGQNSISIYINEVIALGCRIAEVCEPRLDAVVAHESTIQGIEAHTRLPNFVIVAAVKD